MSEKYYISIIIPVFNRSLLLKRAINSVLNQTYKFFELIIIDDNSNENILNIIDDFNDDRIKYFKNQINKGVSYSRNIGIKKSKYNYIAFLDSDDEWLENKLELQIDYLKEYPRYNLIHTNEIWILNGKKINQKDRHLKSGGDIFCRSLELCLISPSAVLINKKIFDTYGLFDENLAVCEDYDMWLRITGKEEVGFIDKPLIIKYGGHSDQLSKKYEAMDKYRVLSLYKIYNDNSLGKIKRQACKITALKKLNILLSGAVKRNKKDDIKKYKELIDFFNYN